MNQRIVLSLWSCFSSFIGFCKSKVTRKFLNCFPNPLLSTQCWLSQDASCLPCTPAFSWVSFPETALLHLRWDVPLTSWGSQVALGGERSTHFDAGQSGRCLKPQEHQWFEFPLKALSSEVPGGGCPPSLCPLQFTQSWSFRLIPWTAWPRAPHLLRDHGWAFSTVSVCR